MTFLRFALAAFAAVRIGLTCAPALAAGTALLAEPQAGLRDRLARARDEGRLTAPLLMWPATSAVLRAAGIEPSPCNGVNEVEAQRNSGERLILGFGDGSPVETRIAAAGCLASAETFAARLRINAERTSNDRRVHLDGSYLGYQWGGLLLTAGAVARYWGPAWSGSVILGDNARPIPSVSVRRADPTRAFETRWLSWLGPWDAEAFFGQLQGHREPRAPRFFGMRVEMAPLPWLAIGLSRTMQWGGQGRSNSLRTFWDAFTGSDNLGAGGIGDTNEPGNQLAGYDLRLSLRPLGVPAAVYTQWIGEDEAGYLPIKFMSSSGAEVWFETAAWRSRVVAEYVDTVVDEHDKYPGTAYRHHIYRQGYTQHGRILGFSLGTDIRAMVVQLHAFGAGAWSGSVHVLRGRANPGAIASLPYAADSPLRAAELRVRYQADSIAAIDLRIGHSRYTPWGAPPVSEAAGGLRVEMRLP
jgi:hypothetical protein